MKPGPVRLLILLVLFLLPIRSADAQNTLIQMRQEGDIRIYVDVASFKNIGDPTQTYVEIYYALDRSQMEFIELPGMPGTYSAAWDIQTQIETEVGDVVTWNRWQQVTRDTSVVAAQANQTAFDIYWPPPLLRPGVYRFITTITDLNSTMSGDTKVGIDERTVVIPNYASQELTLSDIEFSVSLGRASSPNRFVKNDLQVVPNPLRVYGVNIPLLSFYAEVYGLTPAGPEGGTFTRRVMIEGLNVDYRREVDASQKQVRNSNELIAIASVNTGVMPRGLYRLVVEVVDDKTGSRAVREKEFQVISEVAATVPDALSTAEMNEENIQRFRNEIEYLATPEQLREYDVLQPEEKRHFLQDFWTALDENPATAENEFRQQWVQRFEYARDNFTTPTQPEGWKSPQGRIFLMYGQPDDTLVNPMETGVQPWVAWVYDQFPDVGRAAFVFVDDSGGFGSYKLVHSNVPGEIRDPTWWQNAGLPEAPATIPPLR